MKYSFLLIALLLMVLPVRAQENQTADPEAEAAAAKAAEERLEKMEFALNDLQNLKTNPKIVRFGSEDQQLKTINSNLEKAILDNIQLTSSHVKRFDKLSVEDLATVKTLDFSGVDITGDALKIFEFTPALEELNFSFCHTLQDDDLKHVVHLKSLKKINFTKCTNISDKGMSYFSGLTALTHLNLTGLSKVSDKGFKCFEKCESIEELILSKNQMADNGLRYFKKNTGMHTLIIRDCPLISDRCLKYLSMLKSLKTLHIEAAPLVTDKSLKSLTALRQLETLTLSNLVDNEIKWAVVKGLGRIKTLHSISLNAVKIEDDDLKNFGKMRNLKKLDLTASGISDKAVAYLKKEIKDCEILN